jgi:hypothetical protein
MVTRNSLRLSWAMCGVLLAAGLQSLAIADPATPSSMDVSINNAHICGGGGGAQRGGKDSRITRRLPRRR